MTNMIYVILKSKDLQSLHCYSIKILNISHGSWISLKSPCLECSYLPKMGKKPTAWAWSLHFLPFHGGGGRLLTVAKIPAQASKLSGWLAELAPSNPLPSPADWAFYQVFPKESGRYLRPSADPPILTTLEQPSHCSPNTTQLWLPISPKYEAKITINHPL